MCSYEFSGDTVFLAELTWILALAWETLALCLAMWIAIKHFRELQGSSKRWAAEDCFTILVKSHVFYFARFAHDLNVVIFLAQVHTSFVAASTLALSDYSPNLYVCHLLTISDIYI